MSAGYYIADSSHGGAGNEASALAVAPLHTEFQREIDAMQAVYLQERRQLELLVQDMEAEVQVLRGHVESCCGREPKELSSSSLPVPRQISWRLDNAVAMGSFHRSAGETARTSCLQKSFRLRELPGVDFSLRFYPSGGETQALARQALCCRLLLEVSGAASDGLCLGVTLSVALELQADVQSAGAEAAGLGPAARPCRHVGSSSEEIYGCGEVLCDGVWPLDVPAWSIICRAELTCRSWEADVYSYETEWLAGQDGRPCVGSSDEDTDSQGGE